MVKAIKKEKKKKKKKKKEKIKKPPKKQKRTRDSLIQRRTLNVPEIQQLVTDNERGGLPQNTDNMTEDQLLQYYSYMLEGYSPIDNNAQRRGASAAREAIDLARERRRNNPIPKPKSKKMRRDPTPSSGESFDGKLSFPGGRRKSKRRRKKKRRRTIKKKRKKKH